MGWDWGVLLLMPAHSFQFCISEIIIEHIFLILFFIKTFEKVIGSAKTTHSLLVPKVIRIGIYLVVCSEFSSSHHN
jgi:hypothetical protein